MSGIVLWDTPYGVGVHSWDKTPLEPKQIKSVLDQLRVVISSDHFCLVAWVQIEQFGLMAAVLRDSGYTDIAPFFWHKPNQVLVGSSRMLVFCVEVAIIAWMGGRSKNPFKFAADPRSRQNFIALDPPKTNYKFLGSEITPYEKPVPLTQHFIENLTDLGQHVLVLGSGSGSELVAALECGRPVVGVESDKKSYEAANSRLAAYDALRRRLIDNSCEVAGTAVEAAGEDDKAAAVALYEARKLMASDDLPTCCNCTKNSEVERMANCFMCGAVHHSMPVSASNTCRWLCVFCQPRGPSLCSKSCHYKFFAKRKHGQAKADADGEMIYEQRTKEFTAEEEKAEVRSVAFRSSCE